MSSLAEQRPQPPADGLTASVVEDIRRHVAQLVADAPSPTDAEIVQLLQWFGPHPEPRREPRPIPTTGDLLATADQAAS